ncbi:MBL fold metallo-hydrolase [Sulfuracidifex tepidarius]|nr:MBL fold metallo-hydrolase [Sulfuracidifex tepidarius]
MPCKGMHAIPSGPPEYPEIMTTYVICGEKTAIIDPGPSNSVVDLGFVDTASYVILTHLHIDHVGLVKETMERYKEAKIVMKSGYRKYLTTDEGVRRLNESAREVLGDLVDVYGEVEKTRDDVIEVEDGDTVDLGGKKISVIYTPGHAKHHISLFYEGMLFAGDSAGAVLNGVMMPTTPPPIDLEGYKESIKKQISLSPFSVGLSHGGIVDGKFLEEYLNLVNKGEFNVTEEDLDIGGEKGEMLKKHFRINMKGLKGE